MRPLLVFFGLLVGWAAFVRLADVPPFMLPSPEAALFELVSRPLFYARHAGVTASEILAGAGLGLLAGLSFGLLLVRFPRLEPWFWPLLVASQAIPVFAIGPLLTLWIGYNMMMRITMAALIIFFPVAVATRQSLRRRHPEIDALLLSMGAKRWRAFVFVRLPLAFEVFAPGLLVAVATAPIGAVVGEWIGSSAGLGHVMLDANAKVQTDTMIAALFLLCLLGYAFYALVAALVRRLGWWFAPS